LHPRPPPFPLGGISLTTSPNRSDLIKIAQSRLTPVPRASLSPAPPPLTPQETNTHSSRHPSHLRHAHAHTLSSSQFYSRTRSDSSLRCRRCPHQTPRTRPDSSLRCRRCPHQTPRTRPDSSHRCRRCPHQTPRTRPDSSLRCRRCPHQTPRTRPDSSLRCRRCPHQTPCPPRFPQHSPPRPQTRTRSCPPRCPPSR